jgi:hypothetical protein
MWRKENVVNDLWNYRSEGGRVTFHQKKAKQRAGSPRSKGIVKMLAARAPRGFNISQKGTKTQRNNTDLNCRASVYRANIFRITKYQMMGWKTNGMNGR